MSGAGDATPFISVVPLTPDKQTPCQITQKTQLRLASYDPMQQIRRPCHAARNSECAVSSTVKLVRKALEQLDEQTAVK